MLFNTLMFVVFTLLVGGWFYFNITVSKTLKPFFHRFFDWLWFPTEEASEIYYEPGEDEQLEMVITSAPQAVVKIELIYGALKLIGAGLVVSAFLYGWMSLSDVTSNLNGETPWMTWKYFQAVLIPPLISIGGLPFVYYLVTWELKYYRLVVYTKRIIKAVLKPSWLSFPPLWKQINVYISHGPTALIEETTFKTKAKKTEMGDEAQNRTGLIVNIITGGYASRIGLGQLFFPSRVFGAADFFENVAYGFGWNKCIIALGVFARELTMATNTTIATIVKLKLEGAAKNKIEDARNAYARAYRTEPSPFNTEGRGDNIFEVEDPGRWDPKKGKRVQESVPQGQEFVRDMTWF